MRRKIYGANVTLCCFLELKFCWHHVFSFFFFFFFNFFELDCSWWWNYAHFLIFSAWGFFFSCFWIIRLLPLFKFLYLEFSVVVLLKKRDYDVLKKCLIWKKIERINSIFLQMSILSISLWQIFFVWNEIIN